MLIWAAVATLSAPAVWGGDTQAQAADDFDLAVQAVHDKQYRTAIQLFTPLAENGAADAQFNLSLLIKTGLGQPRNFSESYFWAVLSDLGKERRAKTIVTELSNLLPQDVKNTIHQKIVARLRTQLEAGNPDAILKFARVHAEFLEEPNYELAYIWYSIAQAIGQRGGFEGSASVADMLEMDALIVAQNKALEVFEGSPFAKMDAPKTN